MISGTKAPVRAESLEAAASPRSPAEPTRHLEQRALEEQMRPKAYMSK